MKAAAWRVAGPYFEACNCEPICPCRRIGGRPGARSTHGVCLGALTWLIREGHAGELDLAGLAAALAYSYDDDEPGSPWTFVLYLDERADERRREALAAIFLGRLGGSALVHFPWAWKPSECVAVRPARIEVEHVPRRQRLRVGKSVAVRISRAYGGPETVTCGIPGHDRSGEELVAETLRVDEGPLRFEFAGTCGYAGDFDYASGDGKERA